MGQLQKNKLKNVYWIIVCFLSLSMFLFSSCSTPKNQNVQDHNISTVQGEKVNSQGDSKAQEQIEQERRSVEAIQFIQSPNSSEVFIKGNKDLKYTSIKQSFPFGIAVYLTNTRIDDKVVSIVPITGNISNIIPSYADKDKKTAKIEILLNKDLPYTIEKESGALRVIISNETQIVESVKKDTKIDTTKTLQIPKGIAKLSDIEFTVGDEGNTKLTLVTSHPVKYDFSKGNKGILYLNLYKTDIPSRHKRPFETKYFKSAVFKILPIQEPRSNKNSKIEISMRERVPYHVVQDNNTIIVHFEPSSIEPPKFTKADKTETGIITETNNSKNLSADLIQQNSDNSAQKLLSPAKERSTKIVTPISTVNNKLTPQEKEYNAIIGETEYTGEKIKLDFYETDIKNVFRILSGISNKNFAIDKNVTGSVTLTLDNPIPWDQVLDLILAMNQLGKIKNGEVIRIATQSTLASEAKQKQAKFEAIQRAKKAQKALQPLVTEYIPINYADASKDIMPHLKQILTPKRGTISVDTRTNMVIITDTREIVNKAKHLIYTLDNVTPQIMIRAKIVEANRDFSRSLGLNTNVGYNELDCGSAHGP
ncbi:MAG: hypothetical protein KAR45_03100 [Desulfobacteraceae bacterium]|nr:hypothetical protein [Desulfobacteraceae bacterium]